VQIYPKLNDYKPENTSVIDVKGKTGKKIWKKKRQWLDLFKIQLF